MVSKMNCLHTSGNKIQPSKNTSNKKSATAGQSTNLWHQDFDIIDEIKIGNIPDHPGTHLRLVETHNTKKRYIQLWSGLSNEWKAFYRYNVEKRWSDWKKIHASIHPEGSENGRTLRRDVQLERTADDSGRTTRRKTRTKSTKDSKQQNGQQRSKNPRRVQGSAKTNQKRVRKG